MVVEFKSVMFVLRKFTVIKEIESFLKFKNSGLIGFNSPLFLHLQYR